MLHGFMHRFPDFACIDANVAAVLLQHVSDADPAYYSCS